MKKKNPVSKKRRIADSTIRRLSMYHRTLNILEKTGIETISSQKLAEIENITSAQIRKDLSFFGSFGRRGLGYNVTQLKKIIAGILGVNKTWNIALIGSGRLGIALTNYVELTSKNFRIVNIFDKKPIVVGKKVGNIIVKHIDLLEKEIDSNRVNLAILTIPPHDTQSVIDRLAKIGIKGVLYFAPRTINIPKNMIVRNEDTTIELETLTYHISNKTDRHVKAV